MGSAISQLNDLKNKVNKVANMFNDAAVDTGYPGSGMVKFPKSTNPPGTANLDVKPIEGKIPEISYVVLYECLDELKKDGSYRFSGMEVLWTDKTTGRRCRVEKMCGEKGAWRTREIGALDFIKQMNFSTKNHDGVDYVSYCGIDSQIADPAGAGTLQGAVTTRTSTNTECVEGAQGFRLTFHKKLKVITNVEIVYARVSDKKANVDKLRNMSRSFFGDQCFADPNAKIYQYKSPENRYEDFSSLIATGMIHDEYLGGLPVRFLQPAEAKRWQALVDELQLQPLIQVLKTKGNIHRVKLDPAVEDKVVKLAVKVLLDELFKSTSFDKNIKFVMKLLCIIFTDDEGIWKKICEILKPEYKKRAAGLLDDAMNEVKNDPMLAEIQKIEEIEDPDVKGKYQKACPGNPDKDNKGGEEDDVEKIAKSYCLDAAQFLPEYQATFRSKFGAKFHGAPVKGLDRIKAKCQEYKDENKLNASDSVARIMDFLRSTIECKNGKEVVDAFNEIKKMKGDFKIVRVKNNFKDMTKSDYKKILLNIMIYGSQICEVQITFKSMKEGNDINHFLYEVTREHSLYALVSKNLNLNTAFREWLEPLAVPTAKVAFPSDVSLRWQGFFIQGEGKSVVDMGKKDRKHFIMNFTMDKSGKLKGQWNDIQGSFRVDGEIDMVGKTITFNQRMPKPEGGQGYVAVHTGKFIDASLVEGSYVTKEDGPAPAGTGGLFKPDISSNKGMFRIWADDTTCPGLNPSLVAFREVNKYSKIIRKKHLPTKSMKWTGLLRGADKGKDFPITINAKIQDPSKYGFWDMMGNGGTGQGITGSGKGVNKVDGVHSDYDTVLMDLYTQFDGPPCFSRWGRRATITVNGFFLEDLKITGMYDDNGHLGRFELECSDKDAKKQFAPKGENEDDRWELITNSHDGVRQYGQVNIKPSKDGVLSGTGHNPDGEYKVEGKMGEKDINFTRTLNNEEVEFEGQMLGGGVYEGFYRSPSSYGRFKLLSC